MGRYNSGSVIDRGLGNLAIMYMVKRYDKDRALQFPPGLNFELDDKEHAKTIIDKNLSKAYVFDCYQNLLQLSFLYGGESFHFVTCDAEPKVINQPKSLITVSSSERDTVAAALTFINTIHQEVDTVVTRGAVFAGWTINADWAFLVNKAFAYKLDVPMSLTTDPMRTHSTHEYMFNISSIYLQGVWSGSRNLPTLPDVLEYWGYGERDKYPTIKTQNDAVCTDPITASACAEVYMTDMRAVVGDYYRRR